MPKTQSISCLKGCLEVEQDWVRMIRMLSKGPKHHFFGYYGVDAWDRPLQRHLALETDFDDHRPEPGEVAKVGLIDRDSGAFSALAETSAFNLQQGSMMHWIDAGFGAEFTFNDWEDGKLASRAVNPETGERRTIDGAVAAISPVEPIGLGLNFARMAHCRAVVGYANKTNPETWALKPEDDGLFLLDFRDGSSRLLLSISEVIAANPCEETQNGHAWFNHVYFNTDGTRVLFVCRLRTEEKWHTSIWTVNRDGRELEMQIPYGHRTSHFAWRDERRIMISTDVLGTMRFVEFSDRIRDFRPFGGDAFPQDGHNAFSPDRQWVVCDSYPKGKERLATLMLYNIEEERKVPLGEFHHDPKYTKDIRCDLHPRWSRDGLAVSFDSVHGDTRQIYLAEVSDIVQ